MTGPPTSSPATPAATGSSPMSTGRSRTRSRTWPAPSSPTPTGSSSWRLDLARSQMNRPRLSPGPFLLMERSAGACRLIHPIFFRGIGGTGRSRGCDLDERRSGGGIRPLARREHGGRRRGRSPLADRPDQTPRVRLQRPPPFEGEQVARHGLAVAELLVDLDEPRRPQALRVGGEVAIGELGGAAQVDKLLPLLHSQ